jgi:hypothetical protein
MNAHRRHPSEERDEIFTDARVREAWMQEIMSCDRISMVYLTQGTWSAEHFLLNIMAWMQNHDTE